MKKQIKTEENSFLIDVSKSFLGKLGETNLNSRVLAELLNRQDVGRIVIQKNDLSRIANKLSIGYKTLCSSLDRLVSIGAIKRIGYTIYLHEQIAGDYSGWEIVKENSI